MYLACIHNIIFICIALLAIYKIRMILELHVVVNSSQMVNDLNTHMLQILKFALPKMQKRIILRLLILLKFLQRYINDLYIIST